TDGGIADVGRDVDGLGYLKDPTSEIASWSMMIIPIFVGAGTRVKIAEGFSRKCPIVSTSRGAYGYDVSDGKELHIADTAEAFADACLRLIHRPLEAAEMANRAWKKFLEKWTWEAISPKVWAAVEDCLRRQPAL
ncbi:MAG: glycosyltransferase, partial [Syntrophales bacterium LBB04]|nr:glycosyltransferase [Syntrophales bacterium LBB04]